MCCVTNLPAAARRIRWGMLCLSEGFLGKEGMVDVTGIEPVTPCLQIQKANLDGVKKREDE